MGVHNGLRFYGIQDVWWSEVRQIDQRILAKDTIQRGSEWAAHLVCRPDSAILLLARLHGRCALLNLQGKRIHPARIVATLSRREGKARIPRRRLIPPDNIDIMSIAGAGD